MASFCEYIENKYYSHFKQNLHKKSNQRNTKF
jgi:hypothetical protein